MSQSELESILQALATLTADDDVPLRIDLAQRALGLVQRDQNPMLWANLQAELAEGLQSLDSGDLVDHRERAITAYEQALAVLSQNENPSEQQRLIRAEVQKGLGLAYYYREQGDTADNSERAIHALEQSLEVFTQESDPRAWIEITSILTQAYLNRRGGNPHENLDHVIVLYKQLLACTRNTNPRLWSAFQHSLGVTYMAKRHGSRAENIKCAIQAYTQALSVRSPEDMPLDWAMTTVNKALALLRSAEGECGVDQAITLLTQVIEVLRQREAPQFLGNVLVTLADIYLRRSLSPLANKQDQERAIQLLHEALQFQQDFPERHASTARKLGVEYVNRCIGDPDENIKQAITLFKQALHVHTRQELPEEWAETTMQLAIALSTYDWGDSRAENIEQAIELLGQVSELRNPETGLLDWATTLANLANAYQKRVHGGRDENIQEAISLYKQILHHLPKEFDPPLWASTQAELGFAYQQWHLGNVTEDLDQAIASYEQALQVHTRDGMPQEWAMTVFNLISCLAIYPRKSAVQPLKRTIAILKRVLEVLTPEIALLPWVQAQETLALAYLDLLEPRAENVEHAISAIEKVLEVPSVERFDIDHATARALQGVAYEQRIQGDSATNLQIAEGAYRQALAVLTPDTVPLNCLQAATALGNLLFKQQRWAEAVTAYRMALQAMETLYYSSLHRTSREAELSQAPGLVAHAAYAMARAGLMHEAAITLERGRARELNTVLARDRADLERVRTQAPDLYDAYRQIITHLRSLEEAPSHQGWVASSPEQSIQLKELRKAYALLNAVIEDIRRLPGYAGFHSELGFEDIAAAALPNQPLIYLAATASGGIALFVHRAHAEEDAVIEAVWLDGFSEAALKDLLAGASSKPPFGGWFGAYLNLRKDPKTWFDTLERTAHQLWRLVMGPVLKRLQKWNADEAVLIPGGLLGLLPLHAAWENDGLQRTYALDLITFRYTPSARVLTQAWRLATTTTEEKLVLVEDPRPVSARPLPSAHAEAQAITALFPSSPRVLRHEEATRAAVLEALSAAHVAYFICHGRTDWVNPLQSGLEMSGNQRLTVQDLLNLYVSGARLAVLSACETGLIGPQIPDEVVSLPAALLRAGFAGIATSLWPVEDFSTALLMEYFMRAWRIEGIPPAKALRQAQIWLRDTNHDDKKKYLQQFLLGASTTLDRSHPMPEEAACLLLEHLVSQEHSHAFEHPFFWAAFTYIGA
jgi:CHAT domain-containing protein